jgi:hypothetical protein
MRDDQHLPTEPDDDPAIERAIAGLGRFSPRPGFEDRVVGLVRVPLPLWLRGLRDRIRGFTTGVTGWLVLATLSVATVAAWGTGIGLALRYREAVGAGTSVALREATTAVRKTLAVELLPAIGDARAGLVSRLAGLGLDLQTVIIAYAALVLMCAAALRWLTAEPARTRGTFDAAR